MTLRVRHVTTYDYADPVELAAHMVHLRPRTLPFQSVRTYALDVQPPPERVVEGQDHFGNPVAWVFLSGMHEALRVSTDSAVDVAPRPAPDPHGTPAWEHVRGVAPMSDAAEFVFPSPRVPLLQAAREWAAPSFPPGRPVGAGLLDLMHRINDGFRFDPEVTTVSTTVAKVLELRAGVCQDFAHVMIAGLRALGLPARYVSGYLRTLPPPGQARLVGADQSHAWVGCWLGPAQGWVDLDPTNALVVSDGHVVLGWGRDYSDVSPVRGVLLGGGEHTLHVSVDIEPVGEEAAADAA